VTSPSRWDSSAEPDDLFGSDARLALLFAAAEILIVDDEPSNIDLMTKILTRAGYHHVSGLADARRLEAQLLHTMPDLVITDLHMPHRDGFDVLAALQPWVRDQRLPVLVVSGDPTNDSRNRALSLGARDFVGKPFDATELILRVRNQLETRLLFLDVQKQNRALREAVHGRTRQLEDARMEILRHLATAAEYRDDCTARHTIRVAALAGELALSLALDPDTVDLIRRAAPLHDVGKIGVPDGLLRKGGRLSPEETAVMRTHTTIGADILRSDHVRVLQMAEQIAWTHHEHFDGAGYPRGLVGPAIPLAGRIVAVADAFDAITNDRPYRLGRTSQVALEEIVRHRGTQFDPAVVDALVRLVESGQLHRLLHPIGAEQPVVSP
jgi:putative two-component system response regulator